jgi:hypothetical protein
MLQRMELQNRRLTLQVLLVTVGVIFSLSQPQRALAQQWTTNGNNINNTNPGNVGIGTASPTSALEVQATDGPITLSQAGVTGKVSLQAAIGTDLHLSANAKYTSGTWNRFDTNLPSWNFFASPTADYAGIRRTAPGTGAINWTELLVVKNTGNVGIGTSNPGVRLDLLGNNVPYGGQLRLAASDYAQITFFNSNNLALNEAGRKASIYYDVSAGQFVMMNTNGGGYNGPVLLNPNGGNIGIGTFTPAYRLDVQGGQINASGGLCIAGDCKTAWSQVGGNSQWITSGSNIFYNSGNVGVGTTPGYRLDVQSTSNIIARFSSTAAVNNQVLIDAPPGYNSNLTLQQGGIPQWYLGNRAANNRFSLIESAGSAEVFAVLQNGNVGIGTSAPIAKLDVNGDINVTGNIAAKYQDVAEWVPSRQRLAAGTVVVLDTERSNQVLASTRAYDTKVAGVVSSMPGITLGEAGEGKILVATTGRVKVKVDATRAPIRVGDLLVTGDKEGVAMRSEPLDLGGVPIHRPGTLIGKALEPLARGVGEILVLLSLQ